MNKKLLVSLSIIGVVAAVATGVTIALFNDTETSTGNTMTAGTIDLQIDLQCPGTGCDWELRNLNGETFFHEWDIKPGDKGEVTISWHVDSNDAWARIRLADIKDFENQCTEPELEYPDLTCQADPNGIYGELSQYLRFTIWMDEGSVEGWQCLGNGPCTEDLKEGNNVFDVGTYDEKIADNMSVSNLLNGVQLSEVLKPSTTYYTGFEWNLPFATPNIVQTDSLTGKIIMEIVQSKNNPTPWQ